MKHEGGERQRGRQTPQHFTYGTLCNERMTQGVNCRRNTDPPPSDAVSKHAISESHNYLKSQETKKKKKIS